MSENNKSILAETLEEIQQAKVQVEESANFLLTSTLKDELNEIIAKGLTESISPEEDETNDITGSEAPVDSTPAEDAPVTDDAPSPLDPAAAGPDGEEVVDLTGATPDEVIGSFKLMDPTDEIEIVKSENGVQINFKPEGSGDENKIDANVDEPAPGAETAEVPADLAEGEEEDAKEEKAVEESAEPVFEIEITEDDNEEVENAVEEAMSHHVGMERRHVAHNENDPNRVEENASEAKEIEKKEEEKGEVKESKVVTLRKKNTSLVLENKKLHEKLAQINESVKTFKASESDYKKAITTLKNELSEVAVFTTNLTHAVKLMTENATTKDEKIQILKRLDSCRTVNESKEVYSTLNETYKTGRTSAANIIEHKIVNDDKTSGASSKINETTVYKNPGVERIKEIISKINK